MAAMLMLSWTLLGLGALLDALNVVLCLRRVWRDRGMSAIPMLPLVFFYIPGVLVHPVWDLRQSMWAITIVMAVHFTVIVAIPLGVGLPLYWLGSRCRGQRGRQESVHREDLE